MSLLVSLPHSTYFPFDPSAVSSGFNATMETDFLLNASHGFVSSEGWFAEDLQQRLATRRAMVDHCGFVVNMKAQKN